MCLGDSFRPGCRISPPAYAGYLLLLGVGTTVPETSCCDWPKKNDANKQYISPSFIAANSFSNFRCPCWLVHTPKKYADSPGPCLPESGLYFAYGGPHARVSSPRVGCSILMTSALENSLFNKSICQSWLDIEVEIVENNAYPRSPRICVQYGCSRLAE